MLKLPASPFATKLFACAAGFFCLAHFAAQAWPWNSDPQPLLNGRDAIRSDAGSPLAWDRSARVLWYLSYGQLSEARWTGKTFEPREFANIVPKANAGLLADDAWHNVYFLDADAHLNFARPAAAVAALPTGKIGDEPLSRLLAVDARTHSVFAYDAVARGIRRYVYDLKTRAWSSAIIASGLGDAGDAAAWDATLRVLYSSHESADAEVPRHPRARSIADPTGIGAFKPWPLVATAWDGEKWSSRVLDDTGVPQLPAVRATDHTVFYAGRDELDRVRTFRPLVGTKVDLHSSVSGWSGTDTYEDNDQYVIKVPYYPGEWETAGVSGSATLFNVFRDLGAIQLKAPITVVPYFEPVWTDTALPTRLAHYRALINPKQNRLVQHREIYAGEIVREQTGKRIAGYLYRDANGVLAARISPPIVDFGVTVQNYPLLGSDFDPANPPANFAALADPNAKFSTFKDDTSLSSFYSISTSATVDPNAPFVAAHLRLPTSVQTRTLGHRYSIAVINQPGGRYRRYEGEGTGYAELSSLASDAMSGITFYTQSAVPAGNVNPNDFVEKHTSPPLAGFRAPSDFKLAKPAWSSVWIVMVY